MLALCLFTAPFPLACQQKEVPRACGAAVRSQASAESGYRAFPLGFSELLESFAD